MNKKELNDLEQIGVNVSLASTLSLFTGILLFLFVGKLKFVLGILLVLPAFLQLNGAINGMIVSKITSKVNLVGREKAFKIFYSHRFFLTKFLPLILLSSFSLSILAYFLNLAIFNIDNLLIIFIIPLASLLTNIFLFPFDIKSVFQLYEKGVDPDNVIEAYLTSITDIVSVVSLFLTIIFLT